MQRPAPRPGHVARDKMDPHRRDYTSYSPEAGRRGALWTFTGLKGADCAWIESYPGSCFSDCCFLDVSPKMLVLLNLLPNSQQKLQIIQQSIWPENMLEKMRWKVVWKNASMLWWIPAVTICEKPVNRLIFNARKCFKSLEQRQQYHQGFKIYQISNCFSYTFTSIK